MCSPDVSAAFYMRDHGIKPSDLEGLPKPLRGLPAGAVQRLSASGVIQQAGIVYQDRARRVVWGRGSQYSAVMAYLRANP
jgi:hypothetical protein